jgi:DNA-nicking Smr family endonuclease
VRPLRGSPAAPVQSRPRSLAGLARGGSRDLLHESHATAVAPVVLSADDESTFSRAYVRDEVMRKLKRGRIAVEAEIDLHGLRQHAAQVALQQFLNECVRRGLRCVRVIHGKGLRSGPGGPVLKLVVHHWLRKVENVAAFAAARPADGGSGAVYVLLAVRR